MKGGQKSLPETALQRRENRGKGNNTMREFDLIVIGWGKGGKTLAGEAATRGEKVAIIERDSTMIGGTCINTGCIPSKSLVTSAGRGLWCGNASANFEEKAAAYRVAIAEKRRLVAMLREKMLHNLADSSNVTVFNGIGSFLSQREVEITSAAGKAERIAGRRIVINTGSVPLLPEIGGLEGNARIFTSREMLELEELPRRLLIVGGGFIALEFASIYANFGSQVTLVQRRKDFLPREDRDIAQAIADALARQGVKIITGIRPAAFQKAADGTIRLAGTKEQGAFISAPADTVLVAAGRKPDTVDLHPERAGIALSPNGGIAVDEYRRTGVPGVWALGDVVGEKLFTYISLDDSRIVAAQLFGNRERYSAAQRENIPMSVFLTPPYSRIGLNEQEAQALHLDVRIAKIPAAAIPKAQVLKETSGLLKAVVDAKSGAILGVMLFCAESHELVNAVRIAMEAKLPYTVLRDGIYTHPSMSEAFNDLFRI